MMVLDACTAESQRNQDRVESFGGSCDQFIDSHCVEAKFEPERKLAPASVVGPLKVHFSLLLGGWHYDNTTLLVTRPIAHHILVINLLKQRHGRSETRLSL